MKLCTVIPGRVSIAALGLLLAPLSTPAFGQCGGGGYSSSGHPGGAAYYYDGGHVGHRYGGGAYYSAPRMAYASVGYYPPLVVNRPAYFYKPAYVYRSYATGPRFGYKRGPAYGYGHRAYGAYRYGGHGLGGLHSGGHGH